ncbi:MAG: hypothetical protein A2Y74_00065 [Actinobacteria bacterium RBG_13_63_9]|nr:MAG: hypothetical protein A2Y74_00065 [Actinobacteria bacterium RBG_13_63_9]
MKQADKIDRPWGSLGQNDLRSKPAESLLFRHKLEFAGHRPASPQGRPFPGLLPHSMNEWILQRENATNITIEELNGYSSAIKE